MGDTGIQLGSAPESKKYKVRLTDSSIAGQAEERQNSRVGAADCCH